MNFEFSEEQETLRAQARRVLADHCNTTVVRRVLDGDLPMDWDLWRMLVELGWPATALPEQYGGFGMGYLELCVLAEELGRAVAPVPFSSSVYLATEAILQSGNGAQKEHLLPQLASGVVIGTLAFAEGPGSVTPDRIATCFDGHALTGKKLPVADGQVADVIIVVGREAGEKISLFLVEDKGSYRQQPVATIDSSRSHSRLDFDNTPAQRLGPAGEGMCILDKIYDRAAVLYAFEQLGGAQATLEMGISYAKERFAFGRAIGSFQAIKYKLAELYCLVELARSNCYFAAWALSSEAPELALAAATARISATRAYHECAKENMHIHGGIGFTWELDCHLYYRRSKILGLAIGSDVEWKQKLLACLDQNDSAVADFHISQDGAKGTSSGLQRHP